GVCGAGGQGGGGARTSGGDRVCHRPPALSRFPSGRAPVNDPLPPRPPGDAMKLPRRRFLHLAAGAVALPAISQMAWAQTYPTRPVRIIVGFAAGGGADITARLIGQWLSERLGQPFLVEHRPAVASNIAAGVVVRSPADGYTLLLAPHAFNATLYDKLNYNFIRDIAPVASATLVPGVMEVNPVVSAKTVLEFIAYAKVNPGMINMAAGGAGSATHLFGEMFKMMAGVDLAPVQYRGSGPALTDLIGGQVQVMFDALSSSIEHIRAGRLRPFAVTTAARVEVLPNIPTVGEFVPGYEAVVWQGIGAPKNTPAEIVEKLNKEINVALADPKMKARVADLGGTGVAGSPADFAKLIADDTEKWAKVIRAANINAERMRSKRDQRHLRLGGKCAGHKDRLAQRFAQPLQPADQIDGGADGGEIQAIRRAD